MMTPNEKMDVLRAKNWRLRPLGTTSKFKLLFDALDFPDRTVGAWLREAKPFIVQHDWAAFLSECADLKNEVFRPPFPRSLFEFSINGIQVSALYSEADETAGITCVLFVHVDHWRVFGVWVHENDTWVSQGERATPPEIEEMRQSLFEFVVSQTRAASIAIETEIAEAEPRARHEKLNERRVKRGEPPVFDYHVVKLAARHSVVTDGSNDVSKRRSPRLHLRRGHWANLRGIRTWRKWTLVGDPSLGFIDKHYKV